MGVGSGIAAIDSHGNLNKAIEVPKRIECVTKIGATGDKSEMWLYCLTADDPAGTKKVLVITISIDAARHAP